MAKRTTTASAKLSVSTAEAEKTVTLKVTKCQTSAPTIMKINGQKYTFPHGEPVTVPAHVEASLAEVSGLSFEKIKEAK